MSSWFERVAEAAVHDSGHAALVTHAAVRTLWLRRRVAAIGACTELSALCSAVSPARRSGQDR